jgi:hypothetical protein
MPTLDIPKNYRDGDDLYESDLDSAFEYIETALNTTKLDYQNLQSGGVTEAILATGSVTASKLGASAVTTAKIADDSVTAVKLAADTAGDGLIQDTDGSLKVSVDGATIEINADTLRLKDGGVTQAKLAVRATGTSVAAGGVAISASCGNFTTTSASYVDVTNLSVTIVSTGRPIMLLLTPEASATTNPAAIGRTGGNGGFLKLLRDATVVGYWNINPPNDVAQACQLPAGMVQMVDVPAAGTYTYKLQAFAGGGNATLVSYSRLVAYEL